MTMPAAEPAADSPQRTDSGEFILGPMLHSSPCARIYRAWRDGGACPVLLKVPHAADSAKQEAAVLHRLRGHHAPRLLGEDRLRGAPVLAIEKLEGESFESLMRRRPDAVAEPEFTSTVEAIIRALDELHTSGVLHLDLKPDHIWLDPAGEVSFLDFACARFDGDHPRTPGFVEMTPGFTAPELISQVAPPGPESDFYSLGATLFWSATGKPPPRQKSAIQAALTKSALPGALARATAVWLAEDPRERTTRGGPDDIHDEIPPTVRVRRRSLTRRSGQDSAIAPGGPGGPGGPGRSGGRIVLWVSLVLLLIGVTAASAWFGWPLYEKHYKKEWLVDPRGGGDAATIAEVLDRAGDDITVILARGEHAGGVQLNRRITMRAPEGGADAPVILAGASGCLSIAGADVNLSGISFRSAGGPASPEQSCLQITSGRAELANLLFEGLAGPALVAGGGARIQMQGVTIRDAGSDAILFRQGAELFADGLELERVSGFGLRGESGGRLAADTLRVSETSRAGLFLTEGAQASLSNSEILRAGASGVEIARGASAELYGTRVVGSKAAGIFVYEGAALQVERSQISESALSGLIVQDADNLRVQSSQVIANGEHGALLLTVNQGSVSESELSLNQGSGVIAGPEAKVDLLSNVFEGNGAEPLIDARRAPPEDSEAAPAPSSDATGDEATPSPPPPPPGD